MKKLLSIILSITMLLSSAVIVSADGVEGPKPIEKVKVAINAEFPPFEYYENDELKGFDIDLMNAIGEKIGFEIEYVNVHFDAILPSLLSGRVDCGISAITITEERENNFDFTRPYLTAKTTNPSMGSEEYEEYADYAIVFPESTYEKSKVLLAAGERSIYAEVNNAIEQFSKDGTIEKLIEKYKLNESLTDGGPSVTHTVANYTPTNDDENKNPATSATSVPYSDWAKSDIEKAISLNIINYGGNYNYPGAITREEFCELVYSYITNVLSNVLDEEIKPNEYKRVVDTENYAVQCLVGADIIEGKSVVEISATPLEGEEPISNLYDITFAPNDYLTREEAATILLRLINKTIDVPATEMYFEFEDGSEISDWADNAVQVMCNLGVMKGIGEGNFAPKDIYTTEQAIATVVRVYAAQSANTGIIGGADAPADIVVGGGTPGAYTHDFNYKLNKMMPEDENYMFSPLSLKMAFAMVANGAEGKTQTQLLNALGIEDLDAFNEYAKNLMATYNSAEVLKLNVANSLWINKDHMQNHFTKEFQTLAKEYYGAKVNVVDDGNALEEVNGWANEQTFGKIPTIIDKPEFESILANALYFKGLWQNDFPKSATHKAVFTSRDGSEKEIDFMKQTGYFQYYDNGGKAVIALPYKSSQRNYDEEMNYIGTETSEADISMYLIQGEYDMHTDILKGFARNRDREKTYITLKMPKFEFEFETGLNDMMKKMGVVDAFIEGKARFNPMIQNGNNRYYITDSKQKTYIKVDEEGSEAAAVTIIEAGGTSYQERPEPIEVTFDKPFTFVIYDNANNEALFIGEYAFAQ